MANQDNHLVALACAHRETIRSMDALSQTYLDAIVKLADQAMAGEKKARKALAKIRDAALEAKNDINCSAEMMGCNFVRGV